MNKDYADVNTTENLQVISKENIKTAINAKKQTTSNLTKK